jgi:hypothetical protein
VKQAGRYKFFPMDGQKNLSEAEAKARSDNFLVEELEARVALDDLGRRAVEPSSSQ